MIEPTEGEVLVNGVSLERFGYQRFREQVGGVLQDDHLFAGSLISNIALFDDNPDRGRVEQAAEAAAIHYDILAMTMGYNTLVGDMGSTLSGGQKQRVLLARALYRKPKLLVVDEGTSHLDTERERLVNASIDELGMTRIVVAHRTESIMSAKRIFRLQAGQLTLITSDDTLLKRRESFDAGAEAPNHPNPKRVFPA